MQLVGAYETVQIILQQLSCSDTPHLFIVVLWKCSIHGVVKKVPLLLRICKQLMCYKVAITRAQRQNKLLCWILEIGQPVFDDTYKTLW